MKDHVALTSTPCMPSDRSLLFSVGCDLTVNTVLSPFDVGVCALAPGRADMLSVSDSVLQSCKMLFIEQLITCGVGHCITAPTSPDSADVLSCAHTACCRLLGMGRETATVVMNSEVAVCLQVWEF